jgi:hypothetical protein
LCYFRTGETFVRVTVQHSNELALISEIVGWIYFVAWSISFYPQMYENWVRKRYNLFFENIIPDTSPI